MQKWVSRKIPKFEVDSTTFHKDAGDSSPLSRKVSKNEKKKFFLIKNKNFFVKRELFPIDVVESSGERK